MPWVPNQFQPNHAVLFAGAGAGGFSPTSSESTAFLARTFGLDDLHKGYYDTLITGLVTDGDYTKLDVLYIWATDTTSNALLNLCPNAAYNGAVIGTPTSFTANVGYTGDGADFAINSGFNPFTASSPQYGLNSGTLGIYVQSSLTSGESYNAVGADNVGAAYLVPDYFGNALWRINNASPLSQAVASSQGLWIATRTASAVCALYRNGNTTAIDTDTTVADFVPRTNIYFFADNNGGATNFCSLQMSAGFIGKGLTSAEMARIANRINTYMTAYTINVY